MPEMFKTVKRKGVYYPSFKDTKASKLTDETPVCTLQDLINLLGEERALNLYAQLKSMGKNKTK